MDEKWQGLAEANPTCRETKSFLEAYIQHTESNERESKWLEEVTPMGVSAARGRHGLEATEPEPSNWGRGRRRRRRGPGRAGRAGETRPRRQIWWRQCGDDGSGADEDGSGAEWPGRRRWSNRRLRQVARRGSRAWGWCGGGPR